MIGAAGLSYLWPQRLRAGVRIAERRWWVARCALRLMAWGALAIAAGSAYAWGADGHRLIADLAEQRLDPATRTEVLRLLSLEPGATMGSVSTWADDIKSRSTARWHFVNLPDDCSYVLERDCPGGACVVEAIRRQASVLSGQASDLEKLTALKFLIHLVADVHQPMHAGRASDKGGNLVQLRAFGRGTNLHALWDSLLIKHRPGGIDALRGSVEERLPSSSVHQASPEAWAIESCQVSRTPDFVPTERELAPSYATTFDVVLLERIAQAASRLAGLLTAALRP